MTYSSRARIAISHSKSITYKKAKINLDFPFKILHSLRMKAFATTEEINCYIRMTLKQHGMTHLPVSIKPKLKPCRAMGLYFFGQNKKIEIAEDALKSFALFRQVFLHELAHALDENERGSLRLNSGRVNAHGKNFTKWCKKLGIPAGRFIPRHLLD